MVDVLAEDDGFGETVRCLEELGNLGGDKGRALFQHSAVDGNALIIAGRPAGTVVEVVLNGYGLPLRDQPLGLAIARPEFGRGGKLVEGDFARRGPGGNRPVVFQKGIAVGTVDEGNIEGFRAVQRLLHAVTEGVVVVLCLNKGEWEIGLVNENIVGFSGSSAAHRLPANGDPAFREVDLLAHLRHEVPLLPVCADQRGRDELGPNVCFGQGLLVHARMRFPGRFMVGGRALDMNASNKKARASTKKARASNKKARASTFDLNAIALEVHRRASKGHR